MIPQETVNRILDAAQIVDVVGDFVTLKKRGANHIACCPFHNEKTPSFSVSVSASKGIYKCFGCGKSGTAVGFVMEHENMSYTEALKYLAKKYHIEVVEKEETAEEIAQRQRNESLLLVSEYAGRFFQESLSTPEGQAIGYQYFRSRGLEDETIRKYGLGWAPVGRKAFSEAARAAGYKEEFLIETGLSIKYDDGRLVDRFHDRVMFPIHSVSGRVIAFGGRTLKTDKTVAKYVNSPETEIYVKSRSLYGIYFAKNEISRQDRCILVEGYLDVLSMHQLGITNVVASSGTSLTVEQIQLIKRFTRNMTVIYDGDSAGLKASLRGIDMILREGMNVRVVLLPAPEDPDSFARNHTAEEVRNYIDTHSEDFISFKANLLMKEAEGDPIRKAELIQDIVQSISEVPDKIQRSVFIKECARTMDVDENVLIAEVARKRAMLSGDPEAEEFIRRQQSQRRRQQEQQPQQEVEVDVMRSTVAGSSVDALEYELVKYLLKAGHKSFEVMEGRRAVQINIATEILQNLEADQLTFANPIYQSILQTYREHWLRLGEGVEVPAQYFVNHPDPAVCNMAVDIMTSDDNYIASAIWAQKDVHIESEGEILTNGVPKAIMLYRSKVVERMINEQRERLKDPMISEEEEDECLQQLSKLNQVKLAIAKQSKRLIL